MLKSVYTKKDINDLKRINVNPAFRSKLKNLLDEFKQGSLVKEHIAEHIYYELPLHKASSVTWIVYEVCNCFNDHELGTSFLSSLVVEIEDLAEEIDGLILEFKES